MYKGAGCSLLGDVVNSGKNHHGDDGFGNAVFEEDVDMSLLQEKHAVIRLVELVQEHPSKACLDLTTQKHADSCQHNHSRGRYRVVVVVVVVGS